MSHDDCLAPQGRYQALTQPCTDKRHKREDRERDSARETSAAAHHPARCKPKSTIRASGTRLRAEGREDERAGTGGCGPPDHADLTSRTCDPHGSQTPTPSPASRAPITARERQSTCQSNRHSQSGRPNRMRCMATQQAGHWAHSRTELGKGVQEWAGEHMHCVR